jgi:desulfoferrodoxin (superoxide reductase-like protein)
LMNALAIEKNQTDRKKEKHVGQVKTTNKESNSP